MPSSQNDRTYRVWGLPAGVSIEDSELILRDILNLDATEPKVHSLGLNPYVFGRDVDVVATVTFSQTPYALLDGNSWQITKSTTYQNVDMRLSLTIDTHFKGWTPLNTIKDDEAHKIDCIAVSGLSSHPFGSWKQRGGQFMWLRDSLASSSNGVRVLLYGYDTPLVQSESFQDIDDVGGKLNDFIYPIRPHKAEIGYKRRPIVFIAHSLGGILVKEAICQMASTDWWNAQCVYGFIFFGVPNRGIRVTHWLPMVKNQPNESLVRNLAPGSHYLRNLHEKFCQQLRLLQNAAVISVYETIKSKTAKEESPGHWSLTGSTEILVTRDSATDSCPSGLNHLRIPINQNHADLPKFEGPHDSEYQLLSVYLNQVWKEAAGNVQLRFSTEGFTTRKLNQPYQLTDESDQAMLHSAISNNHIDVVKLLLNRGVDIEAKNSGQYTPLRSAVSKGQVEIVKLLLDRGADIEAKERSKRTSLHSAAFRGRIEIVKLLLNQDANIESRDKYEYTSLHFAASNGHVDVARLLLDRGDDIEAKTIDQATPLHCATAGGHVEMIKFLLDRNANIEAVQHSHQFTSLLSAAFDGRIEIVQLLLNRGADIRAKTVNNSTALHLAARKGHFEVVQLLLDRNADIKAKNARGFDPLRCAASNGHSNVFNLLTSYRR